MNFVSAITTYTDLVYRIPCLWNSALNQNSPEALSEINRMLDRIFDKIVIEQGTGKFYRARIVSPKDYDKIQLKSKIVLDSEESGIKGFCSDEMGAPPRECVEDGRANKAKALPPCAWPAGPEYSTRTDWSTRPRTSTAC